MIQNMELETAMNTNNAYDMQNSKLLTYFTSYTLVIHASTS